MISIIIPLYNKEKSIKKAVESILSQSFKDVEVVIVDDGSTDNSAKEAKSFDSEKVKYFYQDNKGVSAARNAGIRASKGEWISFLDGDDYYLEGALQSMMEIAQIYHVDCVASNFYIEKKGKSYLYSTLSDNLIQNPYKYYFYQQFIPRTGAGLFKRKVFDNFFFDERLSRNEDVKLVLALMAKFTFAFCSKPSMVYTECYRNLSATNNCCERDFIFHLDFNVKGWWHKQVLWSYVMSGWKSYPSQRTELYEKYKYSKIRFLFLSLLFHLGMVFFKIRKICKIK